MNEDDGFVFGQNDVRLTGKLFDVFAEAIPRAVQHRTDKDLRLCVCRADARHIPTAHLWSQAIHTQSVCFAVECGKWNVVFAVTGILYPENPVIQSEKLFCHSLFCEHSLAVNFCYEKD